MAQRLTTNPFRLRFRAGETTVNTFLEVDINLPVAVITGGKVQSVELMKGRGQINFPDPEPGQNNSVSGQITRDSQTAILNNSDEDCIFRTTVRARGEDATGIENQIVGSEDFELDFTDGDGNGEIILERTIHAGVQGVGNAASKVFDGYLLAHLVSLTGEEAAVQAFVDDA